MRRGRSEEKADHMFLRRKCMHSEEVSGGPYGVWCLAMGSLMLLVREDVDTCRH